MGLGEYTENEEPKNTNLVARSERCRRDMAVRGEERVECVGLWRLSWGRKIKTEMLRPQFEAGRLRSLSETVIEDFVSKSSLVLSPTQKRPQLESKVPFGL